MPAHDLRSLFAGGVGGVGDGQVLRQLGGGALPAVWVTWTCTAEPLGGGVLHRVEVGAEHHMDDVAEAGHPLDVSDLRTPTATVAAACSLPGEKNTVVEVRNPSSRRACRR